MDDETPLYFCGTNDPLIASVVRGWGKREILWGVQGGLPGVGGQDFVAAAHDAFASWEALIPRRLRPAQVGEPVDILLTTGRIDGPQGVLAWSELPDGSDRPLVQKYDTSEKYVNAAQPPRGKIDLLAVCCHEIGHALGLAHADAGSADLMAPAYQPGRRTPQPGDALRIQRLYGAAAPPPEPGRTITIIIAGAESIRIPGYKVIRE